MTQEEIENLISYLSITKIEFVIKKSCQQKKTTQNNPGPDGFPGEFYETFNKE